ncbi:MAG: hypothetical protein E4H29_03810 [Deltaproteobacteria bacterium]|jgi:hypothetical protein|nr:MAG: hypothetical protein E4H29_03810 [Deltaproteobacteria bacterium]
MEKVKKTVFGRMQTICNCFSAAFKQAREAEIDVPSKRRFRMMYASGDASSALPQNRGTGLDERIARTGGGLRTFLDCLNDAGNRVEQSKTDDLTRKYYRRLPE